MKKLLKAVLEYVGIELKELAPPLKEYTEIPTLEKGIYRKISPMLQERFNIFGSWEDATHGDWLSIEEMEVLWNENIADDRLRDIKNLQVSASKYWDNEASSLFKASRLTIFAGSAFTNEKIYLLWLDAQDEPELWVYDVNGEARYKNLSSYLDSYLNENVTVYGDSWRAKN